MEWLEDLDEIAQGAIIDGMVWGEDGPALSIILSNSCDLEHDKAGFIVLAALVPAAETLQQTKEFKNKVDGAIDYKLSGRKWKSFSDFLAGFIHNKNIGRYYYFNPAPIVEMDPLFVDFQFIKSIRFEQFRQSVEGGEITIIGKLKHPFIEELMMHFVSYTGRVPVSRVELEDEPSDLQIMAGNYHN